MRSMFCAVAAAAAFAAIAVAGATPASALDCKQHFHKGTSTGSLESFTGVKARANWRNEVRQHEGSAWTLWSWAKLKSTKCTKSGPSGKWVCVARARPCLAGS